MEKYKDPNRELIKQYESQKSFITVQKNMNLRYENRIQELDSIKGKTKKSANKQSVTSTKSTSHQNASSASSPAKSSSNRPFQNLSDKELSVTLKSLEEEYLDEWNYSAHHSNGFEDNNDVKLNNIKNAISMIKSEQKLRINTVSQIQVVKSDTNIVLNNEKNKPMYSTSQATQVPVKKETRRHISPWYQVIKNWFIKTKKAIVNFFAEPTKSEISSSQSDFVRPHVLNHSNTPREDSSYDYCNNIQYSGMSRIDKVSQVAGVSKTKDNFRDSLVLANFIREEEKNRAAKKSADIDSLAFAQYLKQNQATHSNKIINSKMLEER